MPVAYVTDLSRLYGTTIFSRYSYGVYKNYDGNGITATSNGFKYYTKGKYMLKYYLRVQFLDPNTYLLGAVIRRRWREGVTHLVLWDRITYHEFTVKEEGEICTILNSIVFDIDEIDKYTVDKDTIDMFVYLTDGTTFFAPLDHVYVRGLHSCAVMYRIGDID